MESSRHSGHASRNKLCESRVHSQSASSRSEASLSTDHSYSASSHSTYPYATFELDECSSTASGWETVATFSEEPERAVMADPDTEYSCAFTLGENTDSIFIEWRNSKMNMAALEKTVRKILTDAALYVAEDEEDPMNFKKRFPTVSASVRAAWMRGNVAIKIAAVYLANIGSQTHLSGRDTRWPYTTEEDINALAARNLGTDKQTTKTVWFDVVGF